MAVRRHRARRSACRDRDELGELAKLHGHDPWADLNDVPTRLPTQLNRRIEELLPHNWHPAR